jgi:hypothetical protein
MKFYFVYKINYFIIANKLYSIVWKTQICRQKKVLS